MKKIIFILSFFLFGQAVFASGVPSYNHVFIVLLENASFTSALSEPFLDELSKGGALLENYSAVAHPSYPNYLALTSGSTFGIHSDSVQKINAKNLSTLLVAQGKTWKNYVEQMPAKCTLNGSGKFAPKHIPFLSYADVIGSPDCTQHIVDSRQLISDIQNKALPNFAFYTPDLNNDGHDTNVAYASNWLKNAFGPLLQDPQFMEGTLFIVTFDEDDGLFGSNQVYTALHGTGVLPGSHTKTHYTHYSLLSTIEEALGLPNLGQNDAKAPPIADIWK